MRKQSIQDFFLGNKKLSKSRHSAGKGKGRGKAEGEKYLAENAKKMGGNSAQRTTIQNQEGGVKPKATDNVMPLWGMLVNGTMFDSNCRQRGEPATFRPIKVIAGWTVRSGN